ncbi:GNAT family N-acetyltransferase [Staphylococcus pseudoxylosus]|uniref:GNAT family N-acetyltransferase n=2 Tax=Staphylococcus TaxID=1279 RepID=UPI00390647EB
MMTFRKLTIEDKQAFLNYWDDWKHTDKIVPFSTRFNRYLNFEEMLSDWQYQESNEDWMKNSTYFYIEDNVIIGAANIRHELTEGFLKRGGHIGYGVAPSFRRKGYATKILLESLKICQKLGIQRVLVTCDEDNIGSAKVIQNAGGIEGTPYIEDNSKRIRRFWIDIKS